MPVLFLMMADRWREAGYESNRILEILLNYIVAPALLIYTAILYLYMAKSSLRGRCPKAASPISCSDSRFSRWPRRRCSS